MSENETTFGQAGQEADAGYEPIPDTRPKDDLTGHYNSEESGLRHAAMDLENSRQEAREEPIDRSLRTHRGRGDPVDDHLTLKLDQAADMMNMVREAESQAESEALKAPLAEAVDRMRADLADLTQQKPERQSEAQPETQPEAPQAQHHEGLDPEVAKAISNPKVAQAIQNEIQEKTHAAEVAKEVYSTSAKQFADTTKQLALLSVGQTLALVAPEIGRLPPNQWAAALATIQAQDPGRAERIHNALATGKHLFQVSQQYEAEAKAEHTRVAQQQAQQHEQAMKAWEAEQVRQFEAMAAKDPQRVETVQKNVVQVFRDDYGISPQELGELAKAPFMKSNAAAKIIMDAVSYRLAQRTAMANPARSVPPVQRPGVSTDGPRDDLSALQSKFARTGNPKDAAKLLIARRARG